MTAPRFEGRVILVVEDEFLLANELVASLEDEGAIVIGPVGTLEEGIRLCCSAGKLDGAILDVNLGGIMVFPLANVLTDRSVPFLFTTGYDAAAIPDQYRHINCYEKPLEVQQVVQSLACIL